MNVLKLNENVTVVYHTSKLIMNSVFVDCLLEKFFSFKLYTSLKLRWWYSDEEQNVQLKMYSIQSWSVRLAEFNIADQYTSSSICPCGWYDQMTNECFYYKWKRQPTATAHTMLFMFLLREHRISSKGFVIMENSYCTQYLWTKTTIFLLHLIRSRIRPFFSISDPTIDNDAYEIIHFVHKNWDSRWSTNQIIFKIRPSMCVMIKGCKRQWIWRILILVCIVAVSVNV